MKFTSARQFLQALNPIHLATLVCLLAVSPGFSQATLSAGSGTSVQNPSLGRGVNVLGYDPIWDAFDQGRFKERYFKMIREGGFDTLRINLYPFRHMGAAPDFVLSNSWWQTTEWIVTNALAADLNVILDFHEYEVTGKDAESNKARFLAFWRQVAPHFQNAPDKVLFEILNEPNGQMTPELWNQCLVEALAILRESNPTRTVIIGPAFWNSIDHLAELKLPEADRHLMVTVHYYSPMSFTHQGAPWAHPVPKLGAVWQGTSEERAAITADFAKAQAWAKAHHRPIFLGEFGAYDKGEMPSRARWTEAVARAAEKNGWSWAYWQFDSDFIVYDISKEQWVEPIHQALIPPGNAKTP
ncbi:MAG: glycoside hydrolase family 5 protein [Verrucomicrobiia bacterium]